MFFFTLFYVLFSFLLIFPPVEFVSCGLTIPSLFSKYVGSEGERFIEYHISRVTLTLCVHSLLPVGYIAVLFLSSDESTIFEDEYGYYWQVFTAFSVILPSIVLWRILKWSYEGWAHHPITLKLSKFANSGEHWTMVASNINSEFRRFDKVTILTSSTERAYITDNWIIKVSLYDVHFANQSDAILIVNSSDTHNITPTGDSELQYINVEVKTPRQHIKPFNIRLLAQDFKDLQDKVTRHIIIMPNIVFHQTIIEKFVDVFKEQVSLNEKYMYTEDLERCIGCMQETSNVKIFKQCWNEVEPSRHNPPLPECTQCNCRPMWCVNCMARWFASRQDQENTTKWLSSKCSCPVCRATFCLLDVAFIET